MNRTRIAFISPEAAPFAKTGGLADVAGSLPHTLRQLNVDIRLVIPGYRQVFQRCPNPETVFPRLEAWLGSRRLTFAVRKLAYESDTPVYIIDREDMFDRPHLYGNGNGDYYDNAERFIFFCRAVVSLMRTWSFSPRIVHCNDWQTGLIPAYLQSEPALNRIQTVFTVHNLGYPGLFDADKFPLTGLDGSHYQPGGLEFYGKWSMLKAGLVYSRAVTTVSPTYAREIQTPEYGKGMDGVLRSRQASLFGLLNGADYEKWDPASDTALPARYTPADLSGKRACKSALIRECGLNAAMVDNPLIGIISRLDVQKGIDLILPILDNLTDALNAGIVILGTGDAVLEKQLLQAAASRPEALAFIPRFDEKLARRIQAGADMLLIPSRYEPCGLTQLYAMKYGTVPVVRATGGLNDTVSEADDHTGQGTGFTFKQADAFDCLSALQKAARLYRNPVIWKQIQFNGMHQDFSWRKAAQNYLSLYRELIQERLPQSCGSRIPELHLDRYRFVLQNIHSNATFKSSKTDRGFRFLSL